MCKVIIESFESQAEAVGFTNWLANQMADGKVKFSVLKAMQITPIQADWDGVDQDQSNNKQIVVNITTGEYDPYDF